VCVCVCVCVCVLARVYSVVEFQLHGNVYIFIYIYMCVCVCAGLCSLTSPYLGVYICMCVVWKYLLGYYPWSSTYEEREALRQQRQQEYHIYKRQWSSVTPDQAKQFEAYRDRLSRVGTCESVLLTDVFLLSCVYASLHLLRFSASWFHLVLASPPCSVYALLLACEQTKM
jgi:hypothetical protein